jgi:hypothetical protein
LSTFAVGKAIQGVTAAYLTRIAGKSFIEYFRHDQDWGDGGMTEVVQQQFQLTRKDEFVKAFVKDAIARVVEPLKQEGNLEAEIEGEIEGDRDDVRSRPDFRPRREPDREYEYEDEDEEYEVPGPLGKLLYDDDDWQVDRRHHDDW